MSQASDSTPANPSPNVAVAEMIVELEQYRERLVNETLETAKRAKLVKSAVMSQLEPELNQIDIALTQLRQQQSK